MAMWLMNGWSSGCAILPRMGSPGELGQAAGRADDGALGLSGICEAVSTLTCNFDGISIFSLGWAQYSPAFQVHDGSPSVNIPHPVPSPCSKRSNTMNDTQKMRTLRSYQSRNKRPCGPLLRHLPVQQVFVPYYGLLGRTRRPCLIPRHLHLTPAKHRRTSSLSLTTTTPDNKTPKKR